MQGPASKIGNPMVDLWNILAARGGRDLSASQQESLSKFLDLLLEANTRMNLTRITSREGAEVQHVGDALTLLAHLPAGAFRLADVGSGGGIPGIPLAIARPEAAVVLIESTRKKAGFLQNAVEQLRLKNVSIRATRAEAAGRSNLRDACDVAVARAVGELAILVEWCLPLVRPGGTMLAMKGARAAEEVPAARNAIKAMAGGEPVTHAVELPGAEHHVIVEISKVGKTPAAYPRDPTVAKGKPVG